MRRIFVPLLVNLIPFGIALVLVLGVGEILVRRIAPATIRTYAPSPTRGWKVLPHLDITWRVPAVQGGDPRPVRIRTDANGFRMGHETGPKKPGTFRIALIGDSFTFGASVHEEHLYANVLERALRKRTGVPVEVVNLGVPAYGVHQEHAMLLEQGLPLRPDLVLVALYLGNDLQETLGLHRRLFDPATGGTREAPDHRIVDGRMVPLAPASASAGEARTRGIKGWLRKHSRLYTVLRDQIKANERWRRGLERIGFVKPDRPRPLPPAERLERLWSGTGMVSLLAESPPALEDAWQSVLRHLDGMHEACRARGIPMAVLVIPYRIQAVPEARRREAILLGLRDQDLDVQRPGRRIAAWGRAAGVPVFDLLPDFQSAADPASLYFRFDSHWNDRGDELAGHALARLLLSAGLVPAPPR